MSSKKLDPFKDFQSDQIQRSAHKIFTAHYACRNAALNLTPVTGTNNGFIFQIINSLIESWWVCLTWFDCKPFSTGEQTFFGWSLPVILLQKVMVSPGTDLVKNQESQSTTCSWPICNQTVNMKTDSKTPYRSILKLKYSPSTIF